MSYVYDLANELACAIKFNQPVRGPFGVWDGNLVDRRYAIGDSRRIIHPISDGFISAALREAQRLNAKFLASLTENA